MANRHTNSTPLQSPSQTANQAANQTPPQPQAKPAGQRFRQLHPEPALRLDVKRSLQMHPRVAAAVFLVVLLGLLGYASRMKAVYEAESRVYIEPAASSPLNDPNGGGLFDSTKYDSYLQQQMQTATRLDILSDALKTLPQTTWAEYGPNVTAAAGRLQGALKVERITTSYQLGISLKGSDPQKTAKIVNAVTTAYLAAGRKDEVARSDSRAQILDEERQRITRELEAARTEQAALSRSIGVAGPASEVSNPYDSQLAAVRGELVTAREQHDAAAAQLSSVAGTKPVSQQGLNALANDLASGDAGLASMKSAVNQRRAQLESQMAGLKPGNPIYRQDQDELADLDHSLDTMSVQLRDQSARRLQDKLRTELERTGDLEARLNGELARGTAAATTAAPKLQRSAELTASIARLTARYATVDDALRTLELETNGLPMAHLSLAAVAPTQPEASRKQLLLIAALPLALLCGCIAASLLHKRERRVYVSRDMEDVLGFAPIAVIPARGDVSDRVVEAYVLRLAAGVESAYRGDGARAFVVTPASASTAIQPLLESVARKLEDLGLTVARLRAAEMLDVLPQSESRSLVQAGEGGRESVVSAALDRLRQAHDIVFIDAAALLTSAEAEYLARCADATILVAECGVTLKQELFDAAVLLERLQVTGVGTVLEELKLRYADSAFRHAVELVDRRPESAPFARKPRVEQQANAAAEPRATAVTEPYPVHQAAEPFVEHRAAVEPVSTLTYGVEPKEYVAAEVDQNAIHQTAAPQEELAMAGVAAAAPLAQRAASASANLRKVLDTRHEAEMRTVEMNEVETREIATVEPIEPIEPTAGSTVSQISSILPIQLMPPAASFSAAGSDVLSSSVDRVPSVQSAAAVDVFRLASEDAGESARTLQTVAEIEAEPAPAAERAVWPAVSPRSDRDQIVREAEQEMLQAAGTSVFLRPRRAKVERLEPLGVQAELAPAADMLANSFGALPLALEMDPADHSHFEPKLTENELVRAGNERKAREIRSRAVEGPAPVPLQAADIRRLLSPGLAETRPVRTETKIETRNGKDMIGARAVSRAARETGLEGWVPDGESAMTEKRNWFQKLFTREIEPLVKIVPEDGDADQGEDGSDDSLPMARTSLYDLTPVDPAPSRSNGFGGGGRAAVAEPETALPAIRTFSRETGRETSREMSSRELSGRETSSSDFKPVARVVSLLTPVVEPEPVAVPFIAVPMPDSPESEAEVVLPAPVAASAAFVPAGPRRPKSFLELSQDRRRPQPAEETAPVVLTHPFAGPVAVSEPVAVAEAPLVEALAPPAELAVMGMPEIEEPASVEPTPTEMHPELEAVAAHEEPAQLAPAEHLPAELLATEHLPEPMPEIPAVPVAAPVEARLEEVPAPVRPQLQAQLKALSWDDVPQIRSSADRWPERAHAVTESAAKEFGSLSSGTRAVQPPTRVLLTEDRAGDPALEQAEPRLVTRRSFATETPGLSRRWGLLSRYQNADEAEPGTAPDHGQR